MRYYVFFQIMFLKQMKCITGFYNIIYTDNKREKYSECHLIN